MSLKRKRVTLTVSQKLRIIDRLDSGETAAIIMSEFSIGRSTVSDIRKAKDKLREFALSQETTTQRKSMKACESDALDKALYTWFCQERERGTPLSGPMVKEKALHFHTKIYGDNPANPFLASDGWLSRFKARHGIRLLTMAGEKKSAPVEEVKPYQDKLKELMDLEGITLDQLYNADETGLYWKMLPGKTLAGAKEKEAPGHKKIKDRITLLACANASGNHKLPLLAIGKSAKPRCFKHVNMESLPVGYTNNKSAWMDW